MAEEQVIHHLNRITLDAQLFLNSLENRGKYCNKIDPNLSEVLKHVLKAVEKFLNQQHNQIVVAEKTQLIAVSELAAITHTYQCKVCRISFDTSVKKIAAHLAEFHTNKTRKQILIELCRRKKEERSEAFLTRRTRSLLAGDMEKLFDVNIQKAEELKQLPGYLLIKNDMLSIITPLFPAIPIKLYLFGSRFSGIATRKSDLDIFVDIGNTFSMFQNRASAITLHNLCVVREAFSEDTNSWKIIATVEKARVPIIKVRHPSTGIICDINFSSCIGYWKTKLMIYLYELQPITRRMCLFLRMWLDRLQPRNFSTHSVCLMVIYFLQLNDHLPAMQQLQSGLSTAVHVGPWIVNFLEKSLEELNIAKIDFSPENCKNLLKRFFEFYAEFKFEVYAVCPYLGRQTEIKHVEEQMPEHYNKYVQANIATNGCALEVHKCLIVQDPIQLNCNATKSVDRFTFKKFIQYLKLSAEEFAKR